MPSAAAARACTKSILFKKCHVFVITLYVRPVKKNMKMFVRKWMAGLNAKIIFLKPFCLLSNDVIADN